MRKKQPEVIEFIRSNIRQHPNDVVKLTIDAYGLTRPAVMSYINVLLEKNEIGVMGATKGREYYPLVIQEHKKEFEISERLDESIVWNEFSSNFDGLQQNVRHICQHGFTEIVNNAIDHSEGNLLEIIIRFFFDLVEIIVLDNGVGIFNKIAKNLNLENPLQSIFELSKGKFTTAPQEHSGEGIFFTSRLFDSFSIRSGKIVYVHDLKGNDVVDNYEDLLQGTLVTMKISRTSKRTTIEVFDLFCEGEDSFGFDRTVVPVHLALYGDDQLLSRSQARRVLERFDRFKYIQLDFGKVDYIGQAFTDEIFRVFANNHPEISLTYSNVNNDVEQMIKHVLFSQ